MTAKPVRMLILVGVLVAAPSVGGALASAGQGKGGDASKLTLKERSSDKAADEQRVNDCKVPPALRGDGHRPADCATGRNEASKTRR